MIKKPETCGVECAHDLESYLKVEGAEYVADFIGEPVGGAACGAIVPHKDYYKIVRDICDHYDILKIDDYGVIPDLICAAKGMSSGYAPFGAVIAKDEIYNAFKDGSGAFVHGHSYAGNPLAASATLAVIKIFIRENILENSKVIGEYILGQLKEKILPFSFVGDVRGKGMLLGVELIKDKQTKEPFLVKQGTTYHD